MPVNPPIRKKRSSISAVSVLMHEFGLRVLTGKRGDMVLAVPWESMDGKELQRFNSLLMDAELNQFNVEYGHKELGLPNVDWSEIPGRWGPSRDE